MDRKILYVYTLLLAVVVINGKGSYIVVAPNSIQPNNDYTVAITLPENTEPSTVEIEIAGGTTFKEKKLIEIPQYNTAITTFQIPMLENTVYTLKVQSIKGFEFSNSTNLKYVKSRHLQNDDLKNIEELQIASIHNETAKRFGPLNLKFKKEKYRIFRDIIMKANSTNPIPFLIYNVVVKGNIVKHEYLEISGDKTMEYITLTPTSDMLPRSNIFVYYMENNVFHWEDLSLFFATKSKCLKNDTEYDHLILNEGDDMDEEAEVEIRKPPGEESGLVILTNTHYSLDSDRKSLHVEYMRHHLYSVIAKMNANSRRLLICDTFGTSHSSFSVSGTNYSCKASCNPAFINLDYMKKKTYTRSIARSMLYSLDRIEAIVREHRRKSVNNEIENSLSSTSTPPIASNNCSVCQQRDKSKQESVESIKKNILSRLHLSHPPNVPTRPVVPNNILDSFQTQCAHKGSTADNNRMKKEYSDTKATALTPATFSLNEFIALYTADDELMKRQAHVDYSHYTKTAEEVKESKWNFNTIHRDHRYSENLSPSSESNNGWYTSLNSIYIFPKKLQLRHNRRADVFNFMFDGDALQFTRTILHVFLWGYDWIVENKSDILYSMFSDNYSKQRKEIVITVYKAFRYSNSTTHAYKWIESRHKIPNGIGHWVEIEIEQLHYYWMKNEHVDQYIIVRGKEPWMQSAFSTGIKNSSETMTLYLEVASKNKGRAKRNAGLDCQENDNEIRCCRYPLKINFTNFGWNFIVAPQHFEAYFCNGECNVGYLEKYTHTHITSLTISAKPCCSPQKLSPLTLLYFDMTMKLMYSTIPNMSVEKCSCS